MQSNRIIQSIVICSAIFLGLISLSACSSGSWKDDPGGRLSAGDWKLTLDQDGITRTVYVHIPSSYTGAAAVPLVLIWHGYMDTAQGQADADGFMTKADETGFIVAYPEGYGTAGLESWNAGKACCGSAVDKDLDDVQLGRNIVTLLSARCSIDAARVYSHGHSNGAGMAHRVGREASDVFAAVSPKSMPVLVPGSLPGRAVPVIHFHGTADSTISYGGGTIPFEDEAYLSAQDSFRNWALVDGCTGSPVTTTYGSSKCETYTSCSEGVRVTLCSIQGGNHNDLYGRDDINVTDMAWDFMSEFTLP
jgi:polyhydroxybutyrate depolymerase